MQYIECNLVLERDKLGWAVGVGRRDRGSER